MLKADDDLMGSNEDTNQESQLQRHENHGTESKCDACLSACRKPTKAKQEQDRTAS